MIVVLNFVCRWFFITGACWCWTFTGFISDILMGTKFIWGIRIICLLVWCWLWMLPWCNIYSTGPIEVLLPFSPLLFSIVIVILWGRVICMCFRSCHQTCSSSYWSNTLLIFVSASPLPVTASTSLHSIKWINWFHCMHTCTVYIKSHIWSILQPYTHRFPLMSYLQSVLISFSSFGALTIYMK